MLVAINCPHNIAANGARRVAITVVVNRGYNRILHAVDMANSRVECNCPGFLCNPALTRQDLYIFAFVVSWLIYDHHVALYVGFSDFRKN